MSSSLHVRCPLFLSDCNCIWMFSTFFWKNIQTSNPRKICSESAEFFHADKQTEGRRDGRTGGRTDMTKLIVVFRNLVNAPKNCKVTYFKVFIDPS